MAQELWLSEKNLNELQMLGTQYVARSGMEDAVSSGILRGRPFGGVSISWSSDLNHLMFPLANYKHKRVVAVELKSSPWNIIFISVYMPYFKAEKRVECMQETLDALSMVEIIIDDHPQHLFVIGGDLNTELRDESPFDQHWKNLMTKNGLAYCDEFITSPRYTYNHEALGQRKFNDHFVISKVLLDQQLSHGHKILDEGDNTSDHLPILMSLSLQIQPNVFGQNKTPPRDTLNWAKLSDNDKRRYETQLSALVGLNDTYPARLCGQRCGCSNELCRIGIQNEYDYLVSCMRTAADSLPRRAPGVEKDWWTADLTRLREQSISIQTLWIREGRPRQGPTHQERLRVRAAYKRALRLAKSSPKQAAWNRLHTAMEKSDSDGFWKWWRSIYNKNSNQFAPVVESCSSKEGITNVFSKCFQDNAKPNDKRKVDELNSRFASRYEKFANEHRDKCDCGIYNVSVANVIDAVCSMKQGKSPDDDGIHAEHFIYAPIDLLMRLTTLFNLMLSHAFVPHQFRFGTMIPIIKDKQQSNADVNNYRGITISPLPSKLFEHVLKLVFSEHLLTSSYQFGFKKRSSTTHALFCLRETINHYIDHGSRVFCSFLDASKAFDRVVHSGLFIKLMDRKMPKCFIDIIINWYTDLQCRVRWDGHLGDWFPVTAGVRQGGVLSPDFYSIYVDQLINILKSSGIGCYVADVFAAALFYADDMAVLSPSIKGLQHLLDICGTFCTDWDICLNARKSKNMVFGKKTTSICNLSLLGLPIEWTCKWKYLGVQLKSGKRFGCSVVEQVKKFYRAANSILRIEGRSDKLVMLRLLEAHCVPIITYGIEVIHVADRDERRSLRVAYNSLFRKIFHYGRTESVTDLQHLHGRKTWEELQDSRIASFKLKALTCRPDTLIFKLNTLV